MYSNNMIIYNNKKNNKMRIQKDNIKHLQTFLIYIIYKIKLNKHNKMK